MQFISAALILALAAIANAQSIPETLTKKGDATTLLQLVSEQPAILKALTDAKGPITVFAPTDAAFKKLLDAKFDVSNKEAVADVLLYHVVGDATYLPDGKTPRTFLNTLRTNPLNFGDATDLRVDV
jgi:uncharacterized surface protein with fasciclin (FAS1) repeats